MISIRTLLGCAALAGLLVQIGCGGGGGASQLNVARGNAASFSEDALILAAREADGPWLSAGLAEAIDKDLARIRAQFPQVADVHAFPDFVLNELLVAVRSDAPWLQAWKDGKLQTGAPAIDSLLAEFDGVKASADWSYDGTTWCLLTFAQPLNETKVAERFKNGSADVRYAEENGMVGDANRITRDRSGKKYTFSVGWGDCPAGCIQRHFWEFTLNDDGSISVVESGSDLSDYGFGRAAAPTYHKLTDTPDWPQRIIKR